MREDRIGFRSHTTGMYSIHTPVYVCMLVYMPVYIYTYTHSQSCFLHSRKHHHQIEKTMTDWKMFTTYIMDIALVSQIFNYPLKLRKKRTGNYIERWTKHNEQWDEVRFATSWSLFSPGGRGFVILFCLLLYKFEVSHEKFWFK